MTDALIPEAVPATPTRSGRGVAAQQRLAEALERLRGRSADPQVLDRRIALGGALLGALGVVLVVLGWYGAAHTSRVYLQIPYLISGGLLGVALAVLGGCGYLASWFTRLVHEERARADEASASAAAAAASLARIEVLLEKLVGSAGAAGTAPASLVATPGGRLAHRVDCPTVTGRTDLRPVTLGGRLAPCRMCGAADDVG